MSVDLQRLSNSLEMGENGVWHAKGHQDLGFLQHDETDWLKIEDNSFWYRHRARVFNIIVSRHHQTGPIFEIGAGNGAVSIELQKSGFDIVAIEPTRRSAYNAKTRGVRDVICSTLENARMSPGQLDNIGIFDVLEHIQEDAAYLLELRRMMPKGGALYCSVPTYDWLWSAEDEYAGHQRRYTIQRLSQIAENAGFNVEYSTYYFRPLVVPIFALRALPTLLGLRPSRSADSSIREHCLREGIVSNILESVLSNELSTFVRGDRFQFGASCFLVCRAH